MKKALLRILFIVGAARLLPHLVLMLVSPNRAIIEVDLARWGKIHSYGRPIPSTAGLLFWMMTEFPEYRTLFYHRIGAIGKLVEFLCPPMQAILISARTIGPGLFIQHGFGTIVTAESIGEYCWINQQVTIGFTAGKGRPTIGDRVTINAGAKVLGGVTIGSDVVIGANAVVVKDVPPNVTVVGVPAYIIRRNGVRVTEPL